MQSWKALLGLSKLPDVLAIDKTFYAQSACTNSILVLNSYNYSLIAYYDFHAVEINFPKVY